jgi:hypothetical protein
VVPRRRSACTFPQVSDGLCKLPVKWVGRPGPVIWPPRLTSVPLIFILEGGLHQGWYTFNIYTLYFVTCCYYYRYIICPSLAHSCRRAFRFHCVKMWSVSTFRTSTAATADLSRPIASNDSATECSSSTAFLHNRNLAFRRWEAWKFLELSIHVRLDYCMGRALSTELSAIYISLNSWPTEADRWADICKLYYVGIKWPISYNDSI